WSRTRRGAVGEKIAGILNRIGALNHVCRSPETHDASQMIRLTEKLLSRGTRIINMFFHSPSLLPNCSPFVRTEGDAADFAAKIGKFIRFARSAGLRFVTMSELRAADVGASRVKLLPA